MDKIFIPVNLNQAHWCLAVIFIQEQKIQYYDSMNGRGILCIKNIDCGVFATMCAHFLGINSVRSYLVTL